MTRIPQQPDRSTPAPQLTGDSDVSGTGSGSTDARTTTESATDAGVAAVDSESAEPNRAQSDPTPDPKLAIGAVAVGKFGQLGKPLNRRSPFFMGFTGGLGALLAWVTYQAIVSVWSILLILVVAGFLAIGLNPAVMALQKLKLPRGGAVAVVALSVFGFISALLWALIPPAVEQARAFGEDLPGTIESLKEHELVGGLVEKYNLSEKLSDVDGATVLTAAERIFGGLTMLLSSTANVLITIILTLYFLAVFDRLKEGAYRLFPESRRERARLLGDEILARIGRYVSGALVIAAIAGICSYIFMEITGVPYPFALALVVALTDLIPQIGAMLGAVVVSVVAFTVSVPVGIAAIIFFIAYQQLENWIIYPRVMKRAVNVSDLAAIIATLLGASLLGVVGVLLAVPACAAIQLIVREIFIPRQDVS